MQPAEKTEHTPELRLKARRAKRIIICCAAVLMLLPLILAWFTGAIGF